MTRHRGLPPPLGTAGHRWAAVALQKMGRPREEDLFRELLQWWVSLYCILGALVLLGLVSLFLYEQLRGKGQGQTWAPFLEPYIPQPATVGGS